MLSLMAKAKAKAKEMAKIGKENCIGKYFFISDQGKDLWQKKKQRWHRQSKGRGKHGNHWWQRNSTDTLEPIF